MTDREMRRMSRGELLELLVAQMEENQILRTRLEQAQKELDEREIRIEKAGSIAQAALALNHVFESAEAAARQYAENLNRLAREEADEIVAQAKRYSEEVHRAADEYLKSQQTGTPEGNGGCTRDEKANTQNTGTGAAAGAAEG